MQDNSSNVQSGFVTGSLEKSKLLEQVRFVWFPFLVSDLAFAVI